MSTPANLAEIAESMRKGVEVKDRTYHLTNYKQCFLGSDAVKFLVDNGHASDVEEAEFVGNAMMEVGLFRHVLSIDPFKNSSSVYYRFLADEQRGEKAKKEDGSAVSWADFVLKRIFGQEDEEQNKLSSLQPTMPPKDAELQPAAHVGVSPMDKWNIALLDAVHPPAWNNPKGDGAYNLVALGAGAGGLVASSAAANVNARVALIEKHLMGGDCLNVGCVPSKALIKAARIAHYLRNASKYGIRADNVQVDFGAVMERMRRLRAAIAPVDSAETKTKKGVDVFIGTGRFISPYEIEVENDKGEKQVLTFKKAVIATGGSPALPPIKGLADVPYTTNLSLYNLEVLPRRMAVIGAGPIGLEMAQAMQRFGSQVTVLARGSKLLPKEDADAAQIVQDQLIQDGVAVEFGVKFVEVTHVAAKEGEPFPEITVHIEQDGQARQVVCDVLLVATGRRPNVDGIGLETAGVEFDTKNGVKINDKMQTTKSHIYAVGDCCMPFQFTHVSGTQGAMAMRNALFFGSQKVSAMLIPWVTFTDPEVAHVGLYSHDLDEKGVKYDTYKTTLQHNDRAILEEENTGFIKVHVKAGTDKILGATIVASCAGEMLSEITLAMQHDIGLGKLGRIIYAYPTQAECIRDVANQYNFTKLTPVVKSVLSNLLAFFRT